MIGRRKQRVPLLSDAEVARLNEEIFEEHVSVERLFAIFMAVPKDQRARCEWVMDQRTQNRIRRVCEPPPLSGASLSMANAETRFRAMQTERILGLPVVIEPFAKLALRVRR